jgi:hypothetical protein
MTKPGELRKRRAPYICFTVWMNEGTGTIQLDDVLCVAR